MRATLRARSNSRTMKLLPTLIAGVASIIAASAWAVTAEETYKAKCSTCHDAGLAGAPRIGDKAEWARRNGQGTDLLYKSALQGKPNTAMMAKGGFTELTDDEVTAVVDYLLAQAGQKRRIPAVAGKTAPPPVPPSAKTDKVDDEMLVARIKAALVKTKDIVANDIKLEAADGVVTLRGVVDNAAQIKRAEEIAVKTKGVRQVDNKLIPKNLFSWD
jgi:cytochrome c5